MKKLFLLTMLLATSAFAQSNVEVMVDGQRYYCSQDPDNSGGSSKCENQLKRITTKYPTKS